MTLQLRPNKNKILQNRLAVLDARMSSIAYQNQTLVNEARNLRQVMLEAEEGALSTDLEELYLQLDDAECMCADELDRNTKLCNGRINDKFCSLNKLTLLSLVRCLQLLNLNKCQQRIAELVAQIWAIQCADIDADIVAADDAIAEHLETNPCDNEVLTSFIGGVRGGC